MALPITLNQVHTTRRKLINIFSPSITAPNESTTPDFAAMDGGSFYVGSMNKGLLISHLAKEQQEGNYKLGLVPIISNRTIFFGDIDDTPNGFDFQLFLHRLAEAFNARATNKIKDVKVEDIMLLKREDSEKRYHVYIPFEFGEVSKDERQSIYKSLNEGYGQDILDTAASTIRIEGFEKWCKRAKAFVSGSRYVPIGPAKQLATTDLLEKVWLNPRGWDEQDESVLSELSLGSQLLIADMENQDDEKSQSMSSQTLSRNTSSLASIAPSEVRESSVQTTNNSIKADVEEKIKADCPEIAHEVLKYPVKTFKRRAGTITLIMDKSEAGRTCKIAGCIHSKSNIYLLYKQKTKSLYQKCFSPKCIKEKPVLIYKVGAYRDGAVSNKAGLPTADDASIAEHFVLYQPLTRVERKDSKRLYWYIFDKKVGYWKRRETAHIM